MPRILIIDDDPVARDEAARTLRGAGYDVVRASSGGIAIEFHQSEPVDLVIANVYMSDGDGLRTLAEINRESPDLGIIAISPSPVPQGYLTAATTFGAKHILMKPFDDEDLLDAVKDVI